MSAFVRSYFSKRYTVFCTQILFAVEHSYGYFITMKHLILVAPQQFGLIEGFTCGLVSLANYASQRIPELDVQLLDLSHIPTPEIKSEILSVWPESGTLFVGITTTTASYQSALRIAQTFKDIDRNCVVILGGHHAGVQDRLVLEAHRNVVDFVVRGEGEIPLVALISKYPLVEDVPGLSYLDSAGVMKSNADPEFLPQVVLDTIPINFLGEDVRSAKGKFKHVTYVSARGCPLKCAFCAVANQTIRAKSVPAVIEDLKYLVEDQGFQRIAIEDNFFAHSPKRTLSLCNAIANYRNQSGTNFTWDCQTRVESLRRPEIVEAMQFAGCEAIYIGVESLVEEHLLFLRKTSNPEGYLKMLRDVLELVISRTSINCYINLQLGLPEERDSHRKATVQSLELLGSLVHGMQRPQGGDNFITLFPMLHVVYPGTYAFQTYLKNGELLENCFETFTSWEQTEEPILKWLGEHFAHGTGGIPIGILDAEKLREGHYEIDSRRVLEVVSQLTAISQLRGIKVFSYGAHLVHPVGATRDDMKG